MDKKHLKIYICIAVAAALGLAALAIRLFAPRDEAPAVPTEAPAQYTDMLRITELMVKNRAVIRDESGAFSDWVELENYSESAVELEGWYLSDREAELKWAFPALSLEPGQLVTVFCGGEGGLNASFSLSAGESVYLFDPAGREVDSVLCDIDRADQSLARDENGVFQQTFWASPGYSNDRAGYAAFCAASEAPGPIVINEVMVSNLSLALQYGEEPCDWVELRNISDNAFDLSGCYLSDDEDDYRLWQLPSQLLSPGETLLVRCSGDESLGALFAGFSLDAVEERLYLSDSSGELMDYLYLHDLPIDGSMGRMDGENGFFYFAAPSPGEPNSGGQRAISDMPLALTPDGAYDDVASLSVELSAQGDIYYTTDGTAPNLDSPVYTGPIEIDKTSVIRALSLEEGCLSSRVATFSYFVNENHSLPVLSLVVDDAARFRQIYDNGQKYVDLPANLALYDESASFNRACSVSMKGWTSLNLPKKSMGVSFKGRYGGQLECDVFGNGISEYSSLSIRAGQDYPYAIFRNELFQELCLEMSDKVLTQQSKYCILYINGEYRGIYCLKEDFSKQYYASHAGVSRDSVSMFKTPAAMDSDFFRDVLQFCWDNDLSIEENYQYICSQVDIDSLIDWFIIEGYSANTDIQGNVRVFRSTENGNKWVFALYDLDWGFWYSGSDFSVIIEGYGNAGNQMPTLVNSLLANSEFRDRLLSRFAQLNKTVLSNENVLAKIDQLQALLEPEAPRDRERWWLEMGTWYSWVNGLRDFVIDNDWEMHNIDQLCWLLNVSAQEREEYFGR